MIKRTPEQREARRQLELTYPKCRCGNTLGLPTVEAGGKKCKRCVDVETLAKNSLYACRECAACGVIDGEFTKDTFGGDIDIQCKACGSCNTGLVALVVADLLARIKRVA